MTVVWVLLTAVALTLTGAVLTFNRLVRLKNMAREGLSGIDVQLKRRTNLIPNLVEAVKGYMGHEGDLLQRVTALRSKSGHTRTLEEKGRVAGQISHSLAGILAVAEGYPDLKASRNFLELQGRLARVEEEIQMARRYYNGTVRELNIKIESFPSNFIAAMFRFSPWEYFEITDPADRAVPRVEFDPS